MWEARIAELAGTQFNRVARRQLLGLGMSEKSIERRVTRGQLVVVEEGVLAVSPVLEDDWGLWMGATLTAPDTFLSRFSAVAAFGVWDRPRRFETVTRPGDGGPRRHGGIIAHRSMTLAGECTTLRGIPITTIERALLDLAPRVSGKALARMVREAIRLKLTTVPRLAELLQGWKRRPGYRRLLRVVARYSGLPLERARSGAEIRAMEILRDAKRPMPRLNYKLAGEEADLSWPACRLIIEVDGGPFHMDIGENARKQACWERAGWTVRRIASDDVYDNPARLLHLAPAI